MVLEIFPYLKSHAPYVVIDIRDGHRETIRPYPARHSHHVLLLHRRQKKVLPCTWCVARHHVTVVDRRIRLPGLPTHMYVYQ